MAGFRLTPQALADITDIWNYIAADNPAAAQRVVDKLQQRARRLAEHPLMPSHARVHHRRPRHRDQLVDLGLEPGALA